MIEPGSSSSSSQIGLGMEICRLADKVVFIQKAKSKNAIRGILLEIVGQGILAAVKNGSLPSGPDFLTARRARTDVERRLHIC